MIFKYKLKLILYNTLFWKVKLNNKYIKSNSKKYKNLEFKVRDNNKL